MFTCKNPPRYNQALQSLLQAPYTVQLQCLDSSFAAHTCICSPSARSSAATGSQPGQAAGQIGEDALFGQQRNVSAMKRSKAGQPLEGDLRNPTARCRKPWGGNAEDLHRWTQISAFPLDRQTGSLRPLFPFFFPDLIKFCQFGMRKI